MRDSDRYKLAWKFQVDDLPPLGSLQPATWPLTDGLLGAPMQATSLLVKGTRDPLFPNLKKRKRANDAAIEATDNSTTSTTHGDKRAKYYCATCPPALAKTPRQFQGSWGNGEDIAPLDHTSKAYTNVNKANWRRAAFKHTCQGDLELKPGCYPQEHHSKRGCIVPIRQQREVVLDTCPGSRVILMDLCNGVPQTKQSPNCSPKAGKVLSTEQVEQGLKHIYHTVADIARENSSHLPMLASSIKAVNNTFCRRLSCAAAVKLVNRYGNEQNFQTAASSQSSFNNGHELLKDKKASPLIVFQPVPTLLESPKKPTVACFTAMMNTVSKRRFNSQTGYHSEAIATAICTRYMDLATTSVSVTL